MTNAVPAGERTQVYREIAGRRVLCDNEGFLWSPGDWSEEIAIALAVESGMGELGDEHWHVINTLREYYAYHGRAPLNRHLVKAAGLSLLRIRALFPDGIKNGARRLAGLPNPKTCT